MTAALHSEGWHQGTYRKVVMTTEVGTYVGVAMSTGQPEQPTTDDDLTPEPVPPTDEDEAADHAGLNEDEDA